MVDSLHPRAHETAGQVPLRIKIHSQNRPTIAGKQAGKVKGQRCLPYTTFLIGQNDSHVVQADGG